MASTKIIKNLLDELDLYVRKVYICYNEERSECFMTKNEIISNAEQNLKKAQDKLEETKVLKDNIECLMNNIRRQSIKRTEYEMLSYILLKALGEISRIQVSDIHEVCSANESVHKAYSM